MRTWYASIEQRPLVIAGAGGLGREVAWLVQDLNRVAGRDLFRLKGFLAASDAQEAVGGWPVLGHEDWAVEHLSRDHHFIVAVGNPILRQSIAQRLQEAGFSPAILIHPSVQLGPRVLCEGGAIVAAGSTLTVDIQVGAHALINLHCTIGHDTQLGAYTVLAPGVHLSGGVTVASGAEVGTGAVVLPQKRLGKGSRLGAGAVLTQDLPAFETWVGVPARPLSPP